MRAVPILLALLAAATNAAALNMNLTAPPEEPREIVWAKPLPDGPIKVLLIAPRFTLRDANELDARLDVNLDTAPIWDEDHLGHDPAVPARQLPDFAAEEVAARVQKLLQGRYDVIVLARFSPALLPEPVQAAIAAQVERGAGLLLVEHGEAAAPAEGPLAPLFANASNAEAALPLLRGVMPIRLAPGGNTDAGRSVLCSPPEQPRVVRIQYADAPPQYHCLVPVLPTGLTADETRLDNAFACVVRACLWAARRDAPNHIANFADAAPPGPNPQEIPPFLTQEYIEVMRDSMMQQPLRPYRIELNAPADRDYEVRVQIRNPGAVQQFPHESEPETLRKGASVLPLQLRVGPGIYLVDVWLDGRKGVVDWFTALLNIPGWPEIESLKPDRTYLDATGSLALQVEVRPTVAAMSQTRHATVYARALSPAGAVLAEAHAPVTSDGGLLQLDLDFKDLEVPLVKVETYAVPGEQELFNNWLLHRVPRRDLYFPVLRDPAPAEYGLVAIAPSLEEFNARAWLEDLQRAGFRAVHAPATGGALFHAANLGLELIPELSRCAAPVVEDGVIRQPCLTYPAFVARETETLRENTLVCLAGTSGAYSLGNGNILCDTEENVCQSPTCLSAFRSFLQREYPDLDALNAAWNTRFPDWEAVLPPTGECIPAWVDFRRAMDQVFATFHANARDQVRTIDPSATAGFRAAATANPRAGYDWAALAGALDWLAVPADAVVMAKVRSYAVDGAYTGVTIPEIQQLDSPARATWLPWYAAFQRFPALWCATPYGSARDAAPGALLLPSGETAPNAQPLLAATAELEAGLANLLLAAEPAPPAIALYESRRSRYLNDADPAFRANSADAEAAWLRLLEHLGYGFRFIPEDRLGPDTLEGIHALVLPMTRALNDHESQAISDFLLRGGAVLADIAPATHDGHAVPRPAGALDARFGIQRIAPGENPVALSLSNGETVYQDAAVQAVLGDADAALRGVPLYIRTGSDEAPETGQTLLLNHVLPPNPDQGGPWRAAVADFLAQAAVPQAMPLPPKSAEAFRGVRFAYTYGAARIAALLPDASAGRERIQFDGGKDATVYNLRTGERYTRARHVSITLEAGQPAIFAALPYRVKQLALAPLPPTNEGDRIPVWAAIEAAGGEPGTHLLKLRRLDHLGNPLPEPPRYLESVNGIGETEIPSEVGTGPLPVWLEAIDLLSGTSTRTPMQIQIQK